MTNSKAGHRSMAGEAAPVLQNGWFKKTPIISNSHRRLAHSNLDLSLQATCRSSRCRAIEPPWLMLDIEFTAR